MSVHGSASLQLLLVVWIFLRSLVVIYYNRWVLSEAHHSWNPPHPLNKGDVGPSKNWVTWGVQNFLLERGDKPERGDGGWFRKGGGSTFFTTLQFRSIAFTFSNLQSFELPMQDFQPHSHPSLVLKPGIICTFLIHSGSLQKMLTALFNLVRNTQKSIWTIFFECQGKVFLSIENILE